MRNALFPPLLVALPSCRRSVVLVLGFRFTCRSHVTALRRRRRPQTNTRSRRRACVRLQISLGDSESICRYLIKASLCSLKIPASRICELRNFLLLGAAPWSCAPVGEPLIIRLELRLCG